MKVKVHVKRKHIMKGIPGDADNCPIALAMREAGIPCCVVSAGGWLDSIPGNDHNHPLPKTAVNFLNEFDRTDSSYVVPFTFEIDWDSEWLQTADGLRYRWIVLDEDGNFACDHSHDRSQAE
jgi:hypothetical protein